MKAHIQYVPVHVHVASQFACCNQMNNEHQWHKVTDVFYIMIRNMHVHVLLACLFKANVHNFNKNSNDAGINLNNLDLYYSQAFNDTCTSQFVSHLYFLPAYFNSVHVHVSQHTCSYLSSPFFKIDSATKYIICPNHTSTGAIIICLWL
jgi:hypothetical protein